MMIQRKNKSLSWHLVKSATIVLMVVGMMMFAPKVRPENSHNVGEKETLQSRSLFSEEEEDPCDIISSFPKEQRCEIARGCDPDGLINYGEFHFCTFEEYPAISIIILILSLLGMFYLLGTTAEEFFCPTLARIAKFLHMPPDVAGLTLLALGNGAPDVFSTMAGINKNNFPIAFGELLGAGVFITTAVIGAVGLVSKCEMQPIPLVRDICFFLFASVIIMFICNDGRIYLWESILFLVYYVFYVVFTVTLHWYRTRKEPHQVEDITEPELEDAKEDDELIGGRRSRRLSVTGDERQQVYLAKVGVYDTEREAPGQIQHDHVDPVTLASEEHSLNTSLREIQTLTGPRYWFNLALYKAKVASKWHKKKTFQKVLYVIFIIPRIVLNLTIPPAKDKHWNRYLAALYPIFSPLAVLMAIEGFTMMVGPVPLIVIVEGVGLLFSILVWFTTTHEEPPKYRMVFIFIGFLTSIIWVFVLADEIVDILQMLGEIANISQAILGMTVLAWGNSVSDLVSDIVVARKGFPGMAIAACFGGPLFNILIGLGVSLTIRCAQIFPEPYIAVLEFNLYVPFFFLMISLLSTLIFIPLNKFTLGRKYAIYLLLLNFVQSGVSLAIEFTGVDWEIPRIFG